MKLWNGIGEGMECQRVRSITTRIETPERRLMMPRYTMSTSPFHHNKD